MLQELLKKHNLRYEDLNYAERETLQQMTEAMAKNELTIPVMKERMLDLINIVSMELTNMDAPKTIWEFLFRKQKDAGLKARLKNYLILYSILSAPEKAKKLLDSHLSNVNKTT